MDLFVCSKRLIITTIVLPSTEIREMDFFEEYT